MKTKDKNTIKMMESGISGIMYDINRMHLRKKEMLAIA